MKKILFITLCAIALSFASTKEVKAQEQLDLTYYSTDNSSNTTYYLWLRINGQQVSVWVKSGTDTNWTAGTNVYTTDEGFSYHNGKDYHIIPSDDMSNLTMYNSDFSYQWKYYYYDNNN